MPMVWRLTLTPTRQVLSTRKRKDVDEKDIQVQVCIYAFDCLFLNGKSLLREPLTARREAMYGSLHEREGEFQFATAKTSRDVEELEVRGGRIQGGVWVGGV